MTNPTLVNHVRRATMAALAATFAILAWASPSAAAGTNSGVGATGGGRVNVRETPSLSGKVVATKNNNARVVLLCQVKGEKVNGTRRTTTMWNKVKGGGYISDA